MSLVLEWMGRYGTYAKRLEYSGTEAWGTRIGIFGI